MGITTKWNITKEAELDAMFNSTGYKYEKEVRRYSGTIRYKIHVKDVKELVDI